MATKINFINNRLGIIAGIDEAGRGPLAGPVVASAIIAPVLNIKATDSKKMTAKQREEVFEFLKSHPEVEWGIGRVSEKVIDRINILEATKLAMRRAVVNLEKKLSYQIGFLLIDGNFGIGTNKPQKSIIKGDEKVFLISLASIVAKVTRDRGMARYHKQYPRYEFACHKGYGTKAHYKMLAKHGPCKIHRKTFRGVCGHLPREEIQKALWANENFF